MEKPHLQVHEWMAVVLIGGLLALLTAIAWARRDPQPLAIAEAPHYVVDPYMTITVVGAVEHAGKLRIRRGATIEDVLIQAKPTPEADTSKLKQNSKMRKNQTLRIPKKPVIRVLLKNPETEIISEIELPKGSTLGDLLKKFSLGDVEDGQKMKGKRNRRLKSGETILLPTKPPVN